MTDKTLDELMGDGEKPIEDMAAVTKIGAAEPEAPAPKKPKASKVEDAIEAADAEVRLHPILSNEEFEAAKLAARAALETERKKAARKAVLETETQRLREEEGMSAGGVKDEKVRIMLDLAPHSPYILINSRPYYHGQTYTVPRHVAETLREVQQRGWRHQDEIDGKSLSEHYQRARQTELSPTFVKNAPSAVA